MVSRRELVQAGLAASALLAGSGLSAGRAFAQQKLTQGDILRFEPLGNVTLLHVADIHAQLVPTWFREPSINLGVGEAKGRVPHITGKDFLDLYKISAGSPMAYALTSEDFASLAKNYGRMGGLDRLATIIKAIRAERGDNRCLLLDCGDTWTNSWTSLQTKAQDIVDCMNLLKPDAMTAHWEFTLGAERVEEITRSLSFPLLAQNIRDTEFEDRVFEPRQIFEKGGVKIAVIGQAYPYTAIANPRWMFPKWAFGLREDELQRQVEEARGEGADLVVLLSHNGFDIDHKMAGRVKGIDIILTSHTHDALPAPVTVGQTLLIATGAYGKFISRLDLDVREKRVQGFRHRLIPIFSDAIEPDAEMAALIARHRAPYEKDLKRVLGRTEGLLYRRGNFQGSLDDVFTDAMLEVRDAEISLSPGMRWGGSLLPGQDITFEDITNASAMTYPQCYRTTMKGSMLKAILEDIGDNIFNPDPYYQGGGDMVRVGGMGFLINPFGTVGNRISNMTFLKTGAPIDASRDYVVAGWASINEGTQGPPIWEVVGQYLTARKTITPRNESAVKVVGL
ncbi:MAG: thiosulfohydrolase SoxB [Beijerinckiaceae bacterium]|nr:thiosulfohydrolase SoxB [Beijerinckiaceae bacterium]